VHPGCLLIITPSCNEDIFVDSSRSLGYIDFTVFPGRAHSRPFFVWRLIRRFGGRKD